MAERGSGVCWRRAASQSHYFALFPHLRRLPSGSPVWSWVFANTLHSTFLRKDARLALGVFPGITLETLPLDVHSG